MPAIDRNVPHVNQTLPDAINSIRQNLLTLEDTETAENAIIQSRLSALEQYSTPPTATSTALLNFINTREIVFNAIRTAKIESNPTNPTTQIDITFTDPRVSWSPLTIQADDYSTGSFVQNLTGDISFGGTGDNIAYGIGTRFTKELADGTKIQAGAAFPYVSVTDDTTLSLFNDSALTNPYNAGTAFSSNFAISPIVGNVYWLSVMINHTRDYSLDGTNQPLTTDVQLRLSAINTRLATIPNGYTQVSSCPLRWVSTNGTTGALTKIHKAQGSSLLFYENPSMYAYGSALVDVSNFVPPHATYMQGYLYADASGVPSAGGWLMVNNLISHNGTNSVYQQIGFQGLPTSAGNMDFAVSFDAVISAQKWYSSIQAPTGTATATQSYTITGYRCEL